MPADLIIDAVARPSGQAPVAITKRPGDSRAYLIDCAPLLRRWELMARASAAASPPDGLTCRARPLSGGTVLEVHLSGGPPAGGPRGRDLPLRLAVVTSQGQIEVALTVRMVD